MSDGNFTKLKRWLIGLSGVWVAVCSVILTKQGVGISGELAWMGTAIAIALFCAELMFNSNFEELNWTILALGLGAYLYSIWTNVEGFYFYRNITGDLFSNFDVTNFGGGLFMDIYPELAIAWAMKESKIGDLFGNFIKTLQNPDKLTEPMRKSQSAPSYKPQQSQAQPNRSHQPQNTPQPQRPQNQPQQAPRPRPAEDVPAFLKNREPTRHQVSREETPDLPPSLPSTK